MRRTDVSTTFDHVAFAAARRLDVESRLHAAAVAFETAHVPLTNQIQLFLRDPAGNGVELTFLTDYPQS